MTIAIGNFLVNSHPAWGNDGKPEQQVYSIVNFLRRTTMVDSIGTIVLISIPLFAALIVILDDGVIHSVHKK